MFICYFSEATPEVFSVFMSIRFFQDLLLQLFVIKGISCSGRPLLLASFYLYSFSYEQSQ